MRYLAIDYGLRRTGLAICDRGEKIASPLAVIQSEKSVLERIQQIVKSENVGGIVLGLPLNMDDSRGTQAELVQEFAERLKSHLNIPVYLQDERLSTFSAQEKLASADLKKSKRNKMLDAVAAAEILQTFLDTQKSQGV